MRQGRGCIRDTRQTSRRHATLIRIEAIFHWHLAKQAEHPAEQISPSQSGSMAEWPAKYLKTYAPLLENMQRNS
jgi:hypothetical protein